MIQRLVRLLSVFAVAAALAFSFGTANAATALCTSDPASGPPGTKFYIYCTGFSPNTYVNAYVVEPDGRAVSGGQVVGFSSNVGGGNVLTDKEGNARFWWQSQDGRDEQPGGGAFAHQLGTWTWVVHQLGPTRTVVAQGKVSITIESYLWTQSGASLQASDGVVLGASGGDTLRYEFDGSGFVRDEYVNLWVSLPPNCSGRANVESASADDPFFQGLFDGFFGPSTVKANEKGDIHFGIIFTARACRGLYHVTSYAPGSGYGAIAEIPVGSQTLIESPGRSIVAVPSSVNALNPVLTILGSGWAPSSDINCWSTRPDGRTFGLGTSKADANGNFAWDVNISGLDSSPPYASEEPGLWSLTCRAPTSGDTALTTVTVHALLTDP